ncbi:MAG: hypothetical protein K9K86_03640 [Pseudomonadales bacterium]|nr:hypothetical protein [Pseudomonadales bacterium]
MNLSKLIQNSLLIFIFSFSGVINAEEDSLGERCISLSRIKSVDVLDNQRIVFHMQGDKDFINVLPHRCPGLRKNQPFMYRTSLSELCDLDIITVLDSGGFGLRPLGSCGLGRFKPMLDSDAIPITDDLKVGK